MASGKLIFNYEDCKGCSVCIEFCPTKILELDREHSNNKGYHLIKVIDPIVVLLVVLCNDVP